MEICLKSNGRYGLRLLEISQGLKIFILFIVFTICFPCFGKTKTVIKLPENPPMVGGDAELDACTSLGLIKKSAIIYIYKKGKLVSSEPIAEQTNVYVCDETPDGKYVGIVFGKKNEDCKVSSPQKKRKFYKGKCKRGWVKSEFLEVVAG